MTKLSIAAIVTSAAYLGFVLNIGLSYGVYWPQMDPVLFMQDFAQKFPLFLPGAFMTLVPAFVLSIILFVKTKEDKQAKSAWKIVFIALLLVNLITSVYHIPVNFGFMDQSYSAAEVTGKLQIWIVLHWVRVILALVASIYAVLGFQKSLEFKS
ncbi:MAG: anthrone oxygenase family protein [Saprospiraceae bacterium]